MAYCSVVVAYTNGWEGRVLDASATSDHIVHFESKLNILTWNHVSFFMLNGNSVKNYGLESFARTNRIEEDRKSPHDGTTTTKTATGTLNVIQCFAQKTTQRATMYDEWMRSSVWHFSTVCCVCSRYASGEVFFFFFATKEMSETVFGLLKCSRDMARCRFNEWASDFWYSYGNFLVLSFGSSWDFLCVATNNEWAIWTIQNWFFFFFFMFLQIFIFTKDFTIKCLILYYYSYCISYTLGLICQLFYH